jgi:hypothetical protein
MIGKQLTEEQFQRATKDLAMAPKSIEMTRLILVKGRKQIEVAAQYGLTRGAVSQAVTKVWEASQVPPGHERVSVVLPKVLAYQVKQWAAEATRTKNKEKE